MEELSDESLLLKYADGDARAFEILYGRHKDALYRFVRRQCGDAQLAYDLVHDIWLKVIGARRRYRPDARFTTYLFTLARNRLIDHYRAQARQPPGLGVTANPVDVQDLPDRDGEGPDERAQVRELVDRSLALVQSLPQDQREILLLYIEGFRMGEIGAIAGVPAETARSRLRRGLRKLKKELEELAP